MNLHEHQSKELLKEFGLPVLRGKLAYTPAEAEHAADWLGGGLCVVKAQVHAGGRGKGGGVKLAKNAAEARAVAEKILGMQLVTPQTGKAGKLVRKIYVEAGCDIAREFYLSFLVDRASRCLSIVASAEGGMDIEEVAKRSPEKIVKIAIDPAAGLQNFHCVKLCFGLGLGKEQLPKLAEILRGLYRAFTEKDLSLLEINPLVLSKQGEFVLLDAKCALDDNAEFRHPELQKYNDYDETDTRELEAAKLDLSYVAMEGSIGCMVNGAGLAMATMDIIKSYGQEPANFLDVGGGATRERVTQAFKIILSDKNVKGILVNIFGGILRCDVLAQGIVEAAKEMKINVPLVVRLQGTNVQLGREILSKSGLKILAADTMNDAAEKIVAAVGK